MFIMFGSNDETSPKTRKTSEKSASKAAPMTAQDFAQFEPFININEMINKNKNKGAKPKKTLGLELLDLNSQQLEKFQRSCALLCRQLAPDSETVSVDLVVKCIAAVWLKVIKSEDLKKIVEKARFLRKNGATQRTWIYLKGAVAKALSKTEYELGEIRSNSNIDAETRSLIATKEREEVIETDEDGRTIINFK